MYVTLSWSPNRTGYFPNKLRGVKSGSSAECTVLAMPPYRLTISGADSVRDTP